METRCELLCIEIFFTTHDNRKTCSACHSPKEDKIINIGLNNGHSRLTNTPSFVYKKKTKLFSALAKNCTFGGFYAFAF